MTTGNVSVGMKEHRIVIAEVTNAASFGDMLTGAMMRGGGGFDANDCHTQHANARLIAAAPELLDAVYETRKLVSEAASIGFNYAVGDWAERLYANQALLSAAIAKAEGRA